MSQITFVFKYNRRLFIPFQSILKLLHISYYRNKSKIRIYVMLLRFLLLVRGVSAADVNLAVVVQSVGLVSVSRTVRALKGALGVGSGQETDGGQGQFDFGAS